MEETPNDRGRLKLEPYFVWEEEAKRLIEKEMVRRGIRYKQLSRLLEKLGVYESPDQLNPKINRKRFSAAFLIACLRAMGVETIALYQFKQEQNKEV